jgi:hypothetical protein
LTQDFLGKANGTPLFFLREGQKPDEKQKDTSISSMK